MDDNKLDDFLRNKLAKYTSPVPKDMWERIQQKKDRKRIIWFWSMLLSLLFITGGYFIIHKKNNTTHNTSVSHSSQNTDSVKTSFVIPNHLKANGAGIYKMDSMSTSKRVKKHTIWTDSKGAGLNEKRRKTQININGISQFEVKHISPANTKYASQKNSNKPIPQFEKGQKSRAVAVSKEKAKIQGDFLANRSGKFKKNNESDSSTKGGIVIMDKVVKPEDTSSNAVNKFSLPKDSSVKKKAIAFASKEKEDSAKTQNVRRWFMEIYGSPDIPFIERNSGDPSYYHPVTSKRNAYTIGVKVGRYFGKHLSLKAGLQFSRVTESFSDSSYLTDHYASLDIPLLVGYDLKTPFIKTSIDAGIIYNLYTWYQGMDIISNIYIGRITEIYKHNTGASVFIGLNLSKQINKKLEIMAEPYYRYRLSYMTKAETLFRQKINMAGVNLGIRYNFFEPKKQK